MFEKEKPQVSALTDFIMDACGKVVEDQEWSAYEVTISFTGRKLSRGFEVKSLKVEAKRRRGDGNESGKI